MANPLRTALAGLVLALALSPTAHAGKKLYVGNLPFSPTDSALRVIDEAFQPPLELESMGLRVESAGTPSNPALRLPVAITLGVTDPDAFGRGDSGFANYVYNGAATNYPEASQILSQVVMLDSDTGAPARMKTGTVKFFNDAKRFSFDLESTRADGIGNSYAMYGVMKAAQTGLTFGDIRLSTPAADGTFQLVTEIFYDNTGAFDPAVPMFALMVTPVPEPASAGIALCTMAASLRMRKRRS